MNRQRRVAIAVVIGVVFAGYLTDWLTSIDSSLTPQTYLSSNGGPV